VYQLSSFAKVSAYYPESVRFTCQINRCQVAQKKSFKSPGRVVKIGRPMNFSASGFVTTITEYDSSEVRTAIIDRLAERQRPSAQEKGGKYVRF
ncbi:MAG TPA: hypothetical protein VK918_05970, partial [Pyrinomonadaceae bacterium]|nr:hypothetical protein [Pyrinomonadaceae bacterium]